MRPLDKGAVPEVLELKGATWREEYLAALAADIDPPHRWNHRDIRDALILETSERCAYCEGPVLAVSFGDIEHMRPRKHFPELVVDWSNLTLACQRCNNEKRQKWDDELPFVNPYEDRIEEHIVFVGAFVWGASPRGIHTIREFGLDSLAKTEARQAQIDSIMTFFQLWSTAMPQLQGVYGQELRQMAVNGAYSAAALAALKSANFPLTNAG